MLEIKADPKNKSKLVLILLAANFYNDPRVRQEAESLIKAGFTVHVFCWDREGEAEDTNIDNKLIVRTMKILTSKEFNKLKYAVAAILLQILGFFYGIKLIRKYRKIIVHANDFNTLLAAYLLKMFFRKRVRVVYDCHELTPNVYKDWYGTLVGKVAEKLEKLLIKCADVVLTVSEPVASYLRTITDAPVYVFYNYPSEKFIPNIGKTEARKVLGLEKDKFIIAYVGSIRPVAAIGELIEAAEILKKRNLHDKIRFVIVGGGALKDEVWNLVKEKNLKDIVFLVPRFVPRDKAILYLYAADISYIIFRGDNAKIALAWKFFESLACGTKVMVNSKTYMADFLKSINYPSIIIEEISSKEIAEALEKELENRDNLDSKKRAEFLWESQEKEFLKIYENLGGLL
ncbi:MAG TPA: glycosyltransferase family 4 protein [Thermococcaceae archaeon]|nr:glycosyltransferase family 4 protein [Thermococcaceae archaeon]